MNTKLSQTNKSLYNFLQKDYGYVGGLSAHNLSMRSPVPYFIGDMPNYLAKELAKGQGFASAAALDLEFEAGLDEGAKQGIKNYITAGEGQLFTAKKYNEETGKQEGLLVPFNQNDKLYNRKDTRDIISNWMYDFINKDKIAALELEQENLDAVAKEYKISSISALPTINDKLHKDMKREIDLMYPSIANADIDDQIKYLENQSAINQTFLNHFHF